MKVLLDTHIFLWAMGVNKNLPKQTIELLGNKATEKYLSAVSSWEIVIKYAKGSLVLPEPPVAFVQSSILAAGINQLPITVNDTLLVGELPFHHKDPFDRLLITQAKAHNLHILTDDGIFDKYEVDIIGL